MLKWFESYLCNRTQFVNINESYSSKCVLSVGVPQGSVLGPVLYLMYTSPLHDVIESYNYAFITAQLDYCNSLFYGLPNYQLRKLQLQQNMAARFVSDARKFDHISPILVKLH